LLSASSSFLILFSEASRAALATNWTLEFLTAFQNCFACASVIDASLISRVNDFPSVLPYLSRSVKRISRWPPTSVRHLARMEDHRHSETLPWQLLIRSSVGSCKMIMVPTESESGPSLVQRTSASRISPWFRTAYL